MRCKRCSFDNPPRTRFCRQCGARLAAPAASPKKGARPGRRQIRLGRLALVACTAVVIAAVVGVSVKVLHAYETLPPVPDIISFHQDSTVYDVNGNPISVLHSSQNRLVSPLNKIAPVMQTALVDTEDHSFYTNPGFDLKSIVRAALIDLRHGSAAQGASTITEQLAKRLFLTDNGTLNYKLQEFMLGLKLARRYSKHQILDMYLNTVYFGDGAFGVTAAANAYFDEAPSQLTLAQASILAGLPQAPSLYDPYVNPKLAKVRQREVLAEMVKYGAITSAQARQAYQAPLNLKPGTLASSNNSYPYPWFMYTLLSQVLAHPGQYHISNELLYHGGLKIYTTLNPTVYNIAQNAVTYWMNHNFHEYNVQGYPWYQAAAVVMDPHNGYVYAIIGGTNPSQALVRGINYAYQPRQTGSSIKPVLDYTPALAKGYTELSVIQDLPKPQYRRLVNGKLSWWPSNDDGYYRGYIDLRDALAISDNNVAVKLLGKIGIGYGTQFANQKFGLNFTSQDIANYGLGLAIGAKPVAPIQMAQAYDTLANGGTRVAPVFITKIVAPNGQVLYQNHTNATPEFSPQVAYIMTNIMQNVLDGSPLPGITRLSHGIPQYATGAGLYPGFPAAGKTGTNNNFADAWFDGFTPNIEVVTWEGRQQEDAHVAQYLASGAPAYGSSAAGPIWRQIIQQTTQALHLGTQGFAVPPGIVTASASITSGELPGPYTPSWVIQQAPFIQGTVPTQTGNLWMPVQVVAGSPKELWAPGCGQPLTEIFLRPPSAYQASLGMPIPADSYLWPPTQTCVPGSGSSSSSSSSSSTSSSSSSSTSSSTSPPSSSSSSSSSSPSSSSSSSSSPSPSLP